jgi:hypothetical protein
LAEPLKNQFGADIPVKIAGMISTVFHRFPAETFVRDALQGYEALDLMQRGKKIAGAMRRHLPDDYAEATEVLIAFARAEAGENGRQRHVVFLVPSPHHICRRARHRSF